jgi:hypothetical protein
MISNLIIITVCQTEEEIDRKLASVYFGGTILNRYLEPKNYLNPIKRKIDWFYVTPSTFIKKEIRLYFQKNKLISDAGLIDESESVLEYFSFNKREINIENNVSNQSGVFVTFAIQLAQTERMFNRRYKRLQEVLAEILGAIKLSMIIIGMLVKPLTEALFREHFVLKTLGMGGRKTHKYFLVDRFKSFIRNYWKSKIYYQAIKDKLDLVELFQNILAIDTGQRLNMRGKDYNCLKKVYKAPETKESFISRKDQFELLREKYQSSNYFDQIFGNSVKSEAINQQSSKRSKRFLINYRKLIGPGPTSLEEKGKVQQANSLGSRSINEEMEIPLEQHYNIEVKKFAFARNLD